MDITELIRHPEQMDKETLYDLRSLLALHPYYQTARILLLQNLYLLHDQSFDEELRKAAVYITDRRVLFNIVEAAHYRLATSKGNGQTGKEGQGEDRTISLIDNFLDSIPTDEQQEKSRKRKHTPADAAVDFVAYLLEAETDEDANTTPAPQLKGQDLIDNFIFNEGGKIQLNVEPDFVPDIQENANESEKDAEDGYFTETLAKIYIKQGRYSKALEIINRLNLNYPKKNAYFADQIRFLEKLIINNKTNK